MLFTKVLLRLLITKLIILMWNIQLFWNLFILNSLCSASRKLTDNFSPLYPMVIQLLQIWVMIVRHRTLNIFCTNHNYQEQKTIGWISGSCSVKTTVGNSKWSTIRTCSDVLLPLEANLMILPGIPVNQGQDARLLTQHRLVWNIGEIHGIETVKSKLPSGVLKTANDWTNIPVTVKIQILWDTDSLFQYYLETNQNHLY